MKLLTTPDRPSSREIRQQLDLENLAAWNEYMLHMTEFAERFQGWLTNHVLLVETIVFTTDAFVFRAVHTPIGALQVRNLSAANTITVVSGQASSSAPTSGVGVYRIPPATKEVVAIGGTQFTVYGTAVDAISLQAFSAGPTPGIV